MRPTRTVVLAFTALAIIESACGTYTFHPFYLAMHRQALLFAVPSALLAGAVLLGAALARRQRFPRPPQWLLLLMLLLPQWLSLPLDPPYAASIPWLTPTRWGTTFLLMIAAPLWLALLVALRLVSKEVPRATAAAAIAGIGAVCLVFPLETYSVAPREVPVLLLHILFNSAALFACAYAAPRLNVAATYTLAGSYLLLSGISGALYALLPGQLPSEAINLREAAIPFLAQTVVTAGAVWLWFWLLERMPLAAFCMLPLAAWTASTFRNFLFAGFLDWRLDIALVIAATAVTVALHARVADEQPVELNLHTR